MKQRIKKLNSHVWARDEWSNEGFRKGKHAAAICLSLFDNVCFLNESELKKAIQDAVKKIS